METISSETHSLDKQINEIDDLSKLLESVKHIVKECNMNHNTLKSQVASFDCENKELSSPNSHTPFLPPKHSLNFGYFDTFMYIQKVDVPIFGGEDDHERTIWMNIL